MYIIKYILNIWVILLVSRISLQFSLNLLFIILIHFILTIKI